LDLNLLDINLDQHMTTAAAAHLAFCFSSFFFEKQKEQKTWIRLAQTVGSFCALGLAGWPAGWLAGKKVRAIHIIVITIMTIVDWASEEGLGEATEKGMAGATDAGLVAV